MLPALVHGDLFPVSQWPDSQMLCDSLCWKYGMLTLSVGWWLPCISVLFYLNYYLKVTRQTKKDYLKKKEFVWTENAANSICKSMLGRKHAFCFVAFTSEHCSTARASWVHLITRTLPVCAFFLWFSQNHFGSNSAVWSLTLNTKVFFTTAVME